MIKESNSEKRVVIFIYNWGCYDLKTGQRLLRSGQSLEGSGKTGFKGIERVRSRQGLKMQSFPRKCMKKDNAAKLEGKLVKLLFWNNHLSYDEKLF